MLRMVDPCIELLRIFARLRRRRIRNFKWTRKGSDVSSCNHSPVLKNYESPLSNNTPTTTSSNSDDSLALHTMGLEKLHDIRKVVLFFGLLNWILCLLSLYVAITATQEECPQKVVISSSLVAACTGFRILWIFGMGITQSVTASVMTSVEQSVNSGSRAAKEKTKFDRQMRRRWYKWWLWWSRVGFLVSAAQFVGASYLTFLVVTKSANYFAYSCSAGGEEDDYFQVSFIFLPVLAWVIILPQCCMGSDVIAWRSLYHHHGEAWKAHYHEMFDYGIREAMCCLGRQKYLSQLDKDEVYSVAELLGDLVAYRARGASHLEVVAGILLLKEQQVQSPLLNGDELVPETLFREATRLHPYAIAAYTGFLLDIGHHPITFPCYWLRRQGILTFWNRNSRPKLEGDNWWRGHAAAFLQRAKVAPDALRKGSVSQTKREPVYFVVVLHESRTVLVAVRGTETPEDLLTDGLSRECELSKSDLHGLIKGDGIPDQVKKQVEETMPHYGHVGVIQAARELSKQLDNLAEDDSDEQAICDCPTDKELGDCEVALVGQRKNGLLTELLGPGGECEGYKLRFVGHSLGGSIAALTALRLYRRYPELHVYAYGVLPCVDAVTADACSSFITSVIYNDEFSSRLSVAALMRLRAAALQAVDADVNTPSALLPKLARNFFNDAGESDSLIDIQPQFSEAQGSEILRNDSLQGESAGSSDNPAREHAQHHRRMEMTRSGDDEERPLLQAETSSSASTVAEHTGQHPGGMTDLNLLPNGMPREVANELSGYGSDCDLQTLWPEELFVPGLVIHMVKEAAPINNQSWWQSLFPFWVTGEEKQARHHASLKDRTNFRDFVISPDMFMDHSPWRCQLALEEILGTMEKNTLRSGNGTLEAAEVV